MPTFSRLPLFDLLFPPSQPRQNCRDVALVCVQHLLETTGSLFEKFVERGILPSNIHVLGKLYSLSPDVVSKIRSLGIYVYENETSFAWGDYSSQIKLDIARMWHQALSRGAFNGISKIIVLDDGGDAIAAVPPELVEACPIVGVEQTMSGIALSRSRRPPISFVSVGSSAAKVLIEPRIIQESLFRQVAYRVPISHGTAGIVGYGYIGRAVSAGLQRSGTRVLVYDKNGCKDPEGPVDVCESLQDLYDQADSIWGCTGCDHLADQPWVEHLRDDKALISCSSKDSEFRSVLMRANDQAECREDDRLADVAIRMPESSLRILRGGFPVNFVSSHEVEPLHDIQMTRALLFTAVMQAIDLQVESKAGREIDLNARRQMEIVGRWLQLHPERRAWYPASVLDVFTNEDSVYRHAGRSVPLSTAEVTVRA